MIRNVEEQPRAEFHRAVKLGREERGDWVGLEQRLVHQQYAYHVVSFTFFFHRVLVQLLPKVDKSRHLSVEK